jgi:hypothetical protein
MKQLSFFTLFFITAIAVLVFRQGAVTEPLPTEPILVKNPAPLQRLKPCLPLDFLRDVELTAAVRYEGKDYYSFRFVRNFPIDLTLEPQDSETLQTTVIAEDELGCQVMVPFEKGLIDSLLKFLPETLARQIALVTLTNDVKNSGGREAYIKLFEVEETPNSDASLMPWIIFPEMAWAREQLGIPLPKNSVVRTTRHEAEFQ